MVSIRSLLADAVISLIYVFRGKMQKTVSYPSGSWRSFWRCTDYNIIGEKSPSSDEKVAFAQFTLYP